MKRVEKMSRKEQGEMVIDLVHAFTKLHSINDVALFVQDLLTKNELKILSKRLRIAKLLLTGMTYKEIEQSLHVSHGTVAKIAVWLAERGDGFRKIIQQLLDNKDINQWKEFSEWDRIKRRYSLYFWPELLLEEIIRNANRKQKERMTNLLNTLDNKSKLHRHIEKILRPKV